jgi:hypothetical protein
VLAVAGDVGIDVPSAEATVEVVASAAGLDALVVVVTAGVDAPTLLWSSVSVHAASQLAMATVSAGTATRPECRVAIPGSFAGTRRRRQGRTS